MSDLPVLSSDDVADPIDRLSLVDQTALVTGAAGGIGRVTAMTLAIAGADIVLADRDVSGCKELADELAEVGPGDVYAEGVDVADPDSVTELFDTTVHDLDGLDVLANVAGIGTTGASADLWVDEWNLIQRVNLQGTFLCSQAAYPHLVEGGRIVNVSSIAGIYGSTRMSHYAAAKAGIQSLTRSLANEWSSDNVRVNAVAPGPILTRAVEAWFDVEAEAAYDRTRIDRPIGSPTEVADAILFLASPLSSYVSGQTLVVGGDPPTQEDVSVA